MTEVVFYRKNGSFFDLWHSVQSNVMIHLEIFQVENNVFMDGYLRRTISIGSTSKAASRLSVRYESIPKDFDFEVCMSKLVYIRAMGTGLFIYIKN